jgi:cytidylate kinase
MASATSGYGFVREKLLDLQRDMAKKNNVIMDGRDIGTCVLPDAQLKVYLTASVHTRALRRFEELQQKGESCELSDIEKDIEERDYRDMHREIAPLKAADDAKIVDSSEMNIEEVVDTIECLATNAGL